MSVELSPRVLELLASRICHDLVSPVGAVNNGVELMQELGCEQIQGYFFSRPLAADDCLSYYRAQS